MTYVLNDGTVLHFCSSKCKKNALKLHRSPKRVRWVVRNPASRPATKPRSSRLETKGKQEASLKVKQGEGEGSAAETSPEQGSSNEVRGRTSGRRTKGGQSSERSQQ